MDFTEQKLLQSKWMEKHLLKYMNLEKNKDRLKIKIY